MLEQLLWWLFIGFIIATILGVVLYFALRWTFMRTAEKMATIVDRSVGGHAAAAFTRLARYADARGMSLDDASRSFGLNVDRLAKLMDSATTLPIVGRVGLDAVLDLIPVFGNFAGAAVSRAIVVAAAATAVLLRHSSGRDSSTSGVSRCEAWLAAKMTGPSIRSST